MAPSRADDDFVFTLSDNDHLSGSELDDEDVIETPKSTKRKRDNVGTNKVVPRKKQKVQAKNKNLEPAEILSEASDDDQGVQDGAIDSDFEFDIGGNAYNDTVEDFDGWGESKTSGVNGIKAAKKGVDIDAIIARRADKKRQQPNGKADIQEGIPEDMEQSSGDEPSSGEDDLTEMPNFDDDELVADDVFGVDAASEEEHELEKDASDDEKDLVDGNSDEDASDGSVNSDDDSVASPTAHPDDLSDQSDGESQSSVSDVEERAKREKFFGKEVTIKAAPGNSSRTTSFQQFSLSRPILRALAALSFTEPTPIQTRAIPVALQGLDVVGSAVTGSGKTAAFLLPILERLLYRPRKFPTTRVAILMPTRELAVQCHSVATALARFTDITSALITGGFSLREQENILKRRPDIVIATPGRFIDHMRNLASFVVESIEILVLDEADRMLETGFEDELDEILRTIPKGRQTMLFSATMTETVDKLVRVGMNRPVRLSVDAKRTTTAGLVQEFVRLRPGREEMRLATLCLLCKNIFTERTIVFFRQKKEAHRIRVIFGLLGLKAGELHGSLSQEQRIQAVNSFREGSTTHLLATDLAARGLDIKNVMTVINFEAPQSHEIYLHRVGRTARAGKSGSACTIAAEPDRKIVKQAVKSARQQGAKIISRAIDTSEVDAMNVTIESLTDEVEAIFKEEIEEKALAQAESQLTRGENLVKHEAEIMSRPKRTWFESEKEKQDAKKKGLMALNGIKVKGEKKKLSNKDKKRLDAKRERVEGKTERRGKAALQASAEEFRNRKKKVSKGQKRSR